MPTVKSFREVGNFISKIVDVKSRDFLIDTWTDLVNTTPVASGKARASWKISPGSPFTKELPKGDYGYPSTPDLSRYTRNWTKWYIANTAPYIQRLNDGYSQQAPVGFIELALQKNLVKYG
jgi:hypothetical protein